MLPRRSQQWLALLAVALTGAACDPPARSSAWKVERREERRRQDAVAQPAPTPGAPTPANARAHTLRIQLEAEPRGLDPLSDPDLAAWWIVMGPVIEPVLRYDPGPTGQPGVLGPGVASVKATPGAALVRLTIREGAHFSDGQPVTSVDLQYSIDVARGRARVPARVKRGLSSVTSVSLSGPREVVLVQGGVKTNPGLLRLLADVPVVPAHAYAPGAFRERPIGSGPFKVTRWDRGQKVVLDRDPAYWGGARPEAGRVDHVEWIVEPDGARALMNAARGDLDVIPALSAAHHPEALTAPGISPDFQPLDLAPAAFEAIVLDASKPPFDDARVRAAVGVAIDRQKIADTFAGGLARPVTSPVWPGGPIEGPAAPAPPPDLARAGALLAAAGWLDGDGDGVRERLGARLRTPLLAISDLPDDPERELIVGALRAIGFVVDVLPGEPGFLESRLKAGGFGAAFLAVRGGPGDDLAPLLGKGPPGGPRATSPALDAALDQTLPPAAPEARLDAAARVAALITTEWPIVCLTAPRPVGLVHRRVRGLVPWGGWFALDGLTLEDP